MLPSKYPNMNLTTLRTNHFNLMASVTAQYAIVLHNTVQTRAVAQHRLLEFRKLLLTGILNSSTEIGLCSVPLHDLETTPRLEITLVRYRISNFSFKLYSNQFTRVQILQTKTTLQLVEISEKDYGHICNNGSRAYPTTLQVLVDRSTEKFETVERTTC